MKKVCFIFFYLMFLLPNLLEAGVVIEEMSYDKNSPADKEKTVTYIQGNQIKVIESEGDYELWDLKKRAVYVVDPNRKIYTGGDVIETVIKEMREGMRKMQEEMGVMGLLLKKKTPAKANPKDKLTFKNTGQTTTIAGYLATKYEIYRGKRLEEELWLSKALETEIKKEADLEKAFLKLFKEMEDALAEFGQEVSSESYLNTDELDSLYEEGYELKSTDHIIGYVSEVTKIEKKNILQREFQIPTNFKKVSSQIFMETEDETEDEEDVEEVETEEELPYLDLLRKKR